MNAPTETLSTDRLLEVLADRRRRTLLRYLAGQGDRAVNTPELAAELAAEAAAPTDDRPDTFERTVTDLCHVHLPKLAETGLVEYDRQHGTVRYRAPDRVETLLDVLASEGE